MNEGQVRLWRCRMSRLLRTDSSEGSAPPKFFVPFNLKKRLYDFSEHFDLPTTTHGVAHRNTAVVTTSNLTIFL